MRTEEEILGSWLRGRLSLLDGEEESADEKDDGLWGHHGALFHTEGSLSLSCYFYTLLYLRSSRLIYF